MSEALLTPQHTLQRRGLMLVLSSPSGAGKTTISRALLDAEPDLSMSVSCTTRPPRPGEVDGKDYIFHAPDTFHAMVQAGDFLEHAEVFGNLYGTPKAPVFEALSRGQDVLFDIDWQGTQQISSASREALVAVFILPPSLEALAARLRTRAQDPEDVVKARMAKASSEMSHFAEYDYVIVNRNLEASVTQVRAILGAERLKRHRQPGLVDFVNGMRSAVEEG